MKKLVIIPGGFHPFHAGHLSLYNSAKQAFPSADVFVASSEPKEDTRPFPFALKKKLAVLAGVPENRFIQVKSPFQAKEITQMYDPDDTLLIFARSNKDKAETEKMVRIKADGTPGYFQMLPNRNRQPMSKAGYLALLPTTEFADGMTSATEIRNKWPDMDQEQKTALINALYPVAKGAMVDKVIEIFDTVIGTNTVQEAQIVSTPEGMDIVVDGLGTYDEDTLVSSLARDFSQMARMLKSGDYNYVEKMLYDMSAVQSKVKALGQYDRFLAKQGQRPIAKDRTIDISNEQTVEPSTPDYIEEEWSDARKKSIDCSNPKGFSEKAHCDGRKARQSGRKTKSSSVS